MREVTFILASNSPRRYQLMSEAGFDFKIVIPKVVEKIPENEPPEEIAMFNARLKATAVLKSLESGQVIIGADTIVCQNEQIYGKPANKKEAFSMLKMFSGKSHQVITGICLLSGTSERCFYELTQVYFKNLKDNDILYYIEQFSPYDKAGAYAIQEWIGLVGIHKIEGCYFNVVGLPVSRILEEIKQL